MRLLPIQLRKFLLVAGFLTGGLVLGSCALVDVPDARTVNIPTPVGASQRTRGINEYPDSVMYLPLGDDILVPEIAQDDPLPYEVVGPFELRGETLAGALQLILAEYDVGIAFETDAAMERQITVANLRGELDKVITRVCSLADLYCAYEDGTLVVKEVQTFTVTLPPIGSAAAASGSSGVGSGNDYLGSVSSGLAAILGTSPIADNATRTLVYTASQRTAAMAERYFQRLRANTAMVVYETYIWEVQLSAGNSAGIDWSMLDKIGKFSISAAVNGAVASDFTNPISIGLPTTGNVSPTDFIEFLSQFGAVKTISQPQITVLSGASAQMRVADTQNYVSEIRTTFTDTQSSTSVSTDTVDSGFTLTIGSSWDKATVYTSVNVEITDILAIDDFSVTGSGTDENTTRIQLPQTTERELNTQIRIRPGDSVLIGGLVRERDNFDSDGLGFMKPVVPHSRTAQSKNLELVIMMRPRVVVYTNPNDPRYMNYARGKAEEVALPVYSDVPAFTPVTEDVLPLSTPPAPASAPVSLSSSPAVDEAMAFDPARYTGEPAISTPAPVYTPAPAPAPAPPPAPVSAGVPPVLSAPSAAQPYRSVRPSRVSGDVSSAYDDAPDSGSVLSSSPLYSPDYRADYSRSSTAARSSAGGLPPIDDGLLPPPSQSLLMPADERILPPPTYGTAATDGGADDSVIIYDDSSSTY